MMRTKLRKVSAGIVAGVLVAAMVLTGTLAWQSISQKAMNEKQGFSNPGGRLHDDFNGENKDVYVENFSDPENGGVPIFARVRLLEYMEIGKDAGINRDQTDRDATPLVAGTSIDNPDGWTVHLPDPGVGVCTGGDNIDFHHYWTWQMGGSTVYMPTFNMNKDSLEADINGSFANLTDVNGDGVADPYEDYKSYNVGDTELGFEIVDIDDNDDDELKNGGIDIQKVIEMDTTATGTVESAPYTDSVKLNKGTDGNGVTHTAKETLPASVITMQQWKDMGCPVGQNYWVYDTDGWAYWADAIQPGTATGLLLDAIFPNVTPDGAYYYGIYVEAQFSTAGDWGKEAGDTFYTVEDEKPSDDAVYLLNKAAGRLPQVTGISIPDAKGGVMYVKAGETLTLNAQVDLIFPSGSAAETYVVWDVTPATPAFVDDTFTPSDSMVGQSFTVTATSSFNPNFKVSAEIYVIPADAEGVVTGASDGKRYVKYADNTYQEILDDGTLGPFECAGKDTTIGTIDDSKLPVYVLPQADPVYGSKFLGPDACGCYWAAGSDGLLGAGTDIHVNGNPWPDNIYEVIATDVEVSAAGDVASIRQGGTLQMSATVTRCGTLIGNQTVTWAVVCDQTLQTGTSINATTGELTIDVYEAVGTELKVIATSAADSSVTGEYTLTVTEWTVAQRVNSVKVGTSDTAPIDGYDWYVLVNDGNKALLWSAGVVHTGAFNPSGTNSQWEGSAAQTYLNSTFYNSLTTMKDLIPKTSLTTLQYGTTTFIPSNDYIFLLSEADLFGTYNDVATTEAQHYTYAGQQLITKEEMRKVTSAVICWLRSPHYAITRVAALASDGTVGHGFYYTTSYGFRPALWVDITP